MLRIMLARFRKNRRKMGCFMPFDASEVSAVGQNGSGGGSPAPSAPSFAGLAAQNGGGAAAVPQSGGNSQPPAQQQQQFQAPGQQNFQQPSQQQAQQAFSLKQRLVDAGIGNQNWQDDSQAFDWMWSEVQKLHGNFQKAQELAKYGQSGQYFEANRQRIEQALAMLEKQGQSQQPAQQQQANPEWDWSPPEWKQEWEQYLEQRDGQIVPKQFADPALVTKYQAYQNWRQGAAEKLLRNPVETLSPGFKPIIEQIATKIAEEKIAAFQAQQYAQSYVDNAKSWMFSDQIAPDGSPQLNEMGVFFKQQYERLNMVPDLKLRTELAQKMVEAEFLRRKFDATQAAPADPNEPQVGQVQQAVPPAQAPNVNDQLKRNAVAPGGTRSPSRGGTSTPASLADRMKGNSSFVDWATAALQDAK